MGRNILELVPCLARTVVGPVVVVAVRIGLQKVNDNKHQNVTRPERGLQLRKKANHEIIRQYRRTVLIYFDWLMN